MNDIIDVIMDIRKQKRELMYYGKKCLEDMKIFFSGYMYDEQKNHKMKIEFLPDLQKFVLEYYDLNDNEKIWQSWDNIISFFNSTDEMAVEEFYIILDLYLKSTN
ncbi:MAG: hypothetical protein WC182_02430 [Bacilli bacterium]